MRIRSAFRVDSPNKSYKAHTTTNRRAHGHHPPTGVGGHSHCPQGWGTQLLPTGVGDTATIHRSCPYRRVKRMPRCAHFSPLLCPVLSALRFSCSSIARVGSSPSLPLAACWSEESVLVSPTAESFGGGKVREDNTCKYTLKAG